MDLYADSQHNLDVASLLTVLGEQGRQQLEVHAKGLLNNTSLQMIPGVAREMQHVDAQSLLMRALFQVAEEKRWDEDHFTGPQPTPGCRAVVMLAQNAMGDMFEPAAGKGWER